jgi:hypothetical protein
MLKQIFGTHFIAPQCNNYKKEHKDCGVLYHAVLFNLLSIHLCKVQIFSLGFFLSSLNIKVQCCGKKWGENHICLCPL